MVKSLIDLLIDVRLHLVYDLYLPPLFSHFVKRLVVETFNSISLPWGARRSLPVLVGSGNRSCPLLRVPTLFKGAGSWPYGANQTGGLQCSHAR